MNRLCMRHTWSEHERDRNPQYVSTGKRINSTYIDLTSVTAPSCAAQTELRYDCFGDGRGGLGLDLNSNGDVFIILSVPNK